MFWNRHGHQSLNKLSLLASRRSLETQDKTLLTQQWFISLLCQTLMLLLFKWEKPPQLPWLSVFQSSIINLNIFLLTVVCATNAYTASQRMCNECPWISNQYSCHAIHRQPHTHTHKQTSLTLFLCLTLLYTNINPVCAAHGSLTVSKSTDERSPMTELY